MQHADIQQFKFTQRPNFEEAFPPAAGRVHEVCGASAAAFALAIAAAHTKGQHINGQQDCVLWLHLRHLLHSLNAWGIAQYISPARLIFANAARRSDLLWMAEEALRDGSAPLVVCTNAGALDLTEGRRLQLAARAGGTTGLMILGDARDGSNAAQTRWQCAPVATSPTRSTLQHWQLIKNKSGTLADWTINWHDKTSSIAVV